MWGLAQGDRSNVEHVQRGQDFFVLSSSYVRSYTECLALVGSFYGWAETISGTDRYLP